MHRLRTIRDFAKQHKKALLSVLFGLAVLGIAALWINYTVIGSSAKYVYSPDAVPASQDVGIVFGGGVRNGEPLPLLKDRLETAAWLLQTGKVRKLIVSGDNRFVDYNEPEVMKNYLLHQKSIAPGLIQLDNAGRSTYETCERAEKVFGLDRAVLVSESTHLPRAIHTCRAFGVEAHGFASDGESSAGLKAGQRFREIMARTKATINLYVMGERTVLGEKISL